MNPNYFINIMFEKLNEIELKINHEFTINNIKKDRNNKK